MILLIGSLIIAAGIGYWAFQRQRIKQAKLKQQVLLEKINSANQLKDEKLRISRDLHDNIGSQLSFVISSLDNLNYMNDETQRREKLNLLASFTKSTLTELRETIWTIQSQEVTVSELGAKVAQFIQQAKTTFPDIEFELEIDSSDRKLSANETVNSFRIIQEALNNAVKYGNPKLIRTHVSSALIFVKDNGCGFDLNQLKKGNGLANMYSRAKEIDSELVIESNESGSSIQLNFR
jgi:signal transduction histidine kinase